MNRTWHETSVDEDGPPPPTPRPEWSVDFRNGFGAVGIIVRDGDAKAAAYLGRLRLWLLLKKDPEICHPGVLRAKPVVTLLPEDNIVRVGAWFALDGGGATFL